MCVCMCGFLCACDARKICVCKKTSPSSHRNVFVKDRDGGFLHGEADSITTRLWGITGGQGELDEGHIARTKRSLA